MPEPNSLTGQSVLITGAAKRVGRALALACAQAGADLAIHFKSSRADALSLQEEIRALGRRAVLIQADLADNAQTAKVAGEAAEALGGPLYALVNNASWFPAITWETTTVEDWNRNLAIDLTAPFLISQAFARQVLAEPEREGRIVNLLDWRSLRPGMDHLPYTIAKAGLAALTRSLGQALAPRITVNGLALGAILPEEGDPNTDRHVKAVPAGRWASLDEVAETLLFLLTGPAYITGEIIHVDGGRHLK